MNSADYRAFEAELLGRFKAAYGNVEPALRINIQPVGGPGDWAEIMIETVDGGMSDVPFLECFVDIGATTTAWSKIEVAANRVLMKAKVR